MQLWGKSILGREEAPSAQQKSHKRAQLHFVNQLKDDKAGTEWTNGRLVENKARNVGEGQMVKDKIGCG